MLMPREQVRDFLIKYQDRILYGTDLDLLATANGAETVTEWQSTYSRDWEFLATGGLVGMEGKQVQGLELPRAVLEKIFRENARVWIPGI